MVKIEIKETFNLRGDLWAVVQADKTFYKVGDEVIDQNGKCYKIKNVVFPSRPPVRKELTLVLEKLRSY